MENFKVTREQILKYNMQDEFPEVFKLETDKWCIVRHDTMQDAIIFFQGAHVEGTYGFNHYGEWTDLYNNSIIHTRSAEIVRLATDSEVRSALVEQAKSRGVWDAPMVSVSGLTDYSGTYIEALSLNLMELWSRFGIVFSDGSWATTITNLTVKERLERIEKHLGL